MAMRASHHSGRTRKSGKAYAVRHNDRSFKSRNDERHDPARRHLNVYLAIDESGSLRDVDGETQTLEAAERAFYRRILSDTVEARNERCRKQRHPDRCISIDDYYANPRTCPEEVILQIGDDGRYRDLDTFCSCIRAYVQEHTRRYPEIPILSVAIHADETSLHAHVRKVYLAKDKDGHTEVNQHRCLEACGYTLPHENQVRGQFNNLKIPYSEDTRELWLNVCASHGITLLREPAMLSRKSRDLDDYKNRVARQKRIESEARLAEIQSDLESKRAACHLEEERAARSRGKAKEIFGQLLRLIRDSEDVRGHRVLAELLSERYPDIYRKLTDLMETDYDAAIKLGAEMSKELEQLAKTLTVDPSDIPELDEIYQAIDEDDPEMSDIHLMLEEMDSETGVLAPSPERKDKGADYGH